LAASWHTNVHQYAEQRTSRLLSFLPKPGKQNWEPAIRQASLPATLRFYRIPRFLFAPNQELIELLEKGTGKAFYPIGRGDDTTCLTCYVATAPTVTLYSATSAASPPRRTFAI
jgi:phosphatidylinositol alpha 1,6-mannosyltransferase